MFVRVSTTSSWHVTFVDSLADLSASLREGNSVLVAGRRVASQPGNNPSKPKFDNVKIITQMVAEDFAVR